VCLIQEPEWLSQYSVWLRTGRPGNRVRSPAGTKDFFSLTSVSRPALRHTSLLYNGYRGSFPRSKARPGRDADQSPHLVPRWGLSRSYISSPPSATMACNGTALLFLCLLRMTTALLQRRTLIGKPTTMTSFCRSLLLHTDDPRF
jgi:hypothetical protein